MPIQQIDPQQKRENFSIQVKERITYLWALINTLWQKPEEPQYITNFREFLFSEQQKGKYNDRKEEIEEVLNKYTSVAYFLEKLLEFQTKRTSEETDEKELKDLHFDIQQCDETHAGLLLDGLSSERTPVIEKDDEYENTNLSRFTIEILKWFLLDPIKLCGVFDCKNYFAIDRQDENSLKQQIQNKKGIYEKAFFEILSRKKQYQRQATLLSLTEQYSEDIKKILLNNSEVFAVEENIVDETIDHQQEMENAPTSVIVQSSEQDTAIQEEKALSSATATVTSSQTNIIIPEPVEKRVIETDSGSQSCTEDTENQVNFILDFARQIRNRRKEKSILTKIKEFFSTTNDPFKQDREEFFLLLKENLTEEKCKYVLSKIPKEKPVFRNQKRVREENDFYSLLITAECAVLEIAMDKTHAHFGHSASSLDLALNALRESAIIFYSTAKLLLDEYGELECQKGGWLARAIYIKRNRLLTERQQQINDIYTQLLVQQEEINLGLSECNKKNKDNIITAFSELPQTLIATNKKTLDEAFANIISAITTSSDVVIGHALLQPTLLPCSDIEQHQDTHSQHAVSFNQRSIGLEILCTGKALSNSALTLLCANTVIAFDDQKLALLLEERELQHTRLEQTVQRIFEEIGEGTANILEYREFLSQVIAYFKSIRYEPALQKILNLLPARHSEPKIECREPTLREEIESFLKPKAHWQSEIQAVLKSSIEDVQYVIQEIYKFTNEHEFPKEINITELLEIINESTNTGFTYKDSLERNQQLKRLDMLIQRIGQQNYQRFVELFDELVKRKNKVLTLKTIRTEIEVLLQKPMMITKRQMILIFENYGKNYESIVQESKRKRKYLTPT